MKNLFVEFENENVLRSYPFASSCTFKGKYSIGTGVFIDAIFYPLNPKGTLYLSEINTDYVVKISDDSGVIMTATYEYGASVLEFYDTSNLRRHVGTMVAASTEALSTVMATYKTQTFSSDETKFASSCVFPIINEGVLSINIDKTTSIDGDVEFINTNDGPVRVSSSDGNTLRFDVIPAPEIRDIHAIEHIYCIVDGKTPFRITKVPVESGGGNTVLLYLDNIDRDMLCSNTHRENSLEQRDTCACTPETPDSVVSIEYKYQTAVVDIINNTDNAFFLVPENILGEGINPLSITLSDNGIVPKPEIKEEDLVDGIDGLTDDIKAKAVNLTVPGLN